MYSISIINSLNASKAAEAAATRGSYNQRPNGDVLLSWGTPGGRRKTKTLTGDDACSFLAEIDKRKTKTGKIAAKTTDLVIGEYFLEPFTYGYTTRSLSGQSIDLVTLKRARGDEAPEYKTIEKPKLVRQFLLEADNVNVPTHHTKKREEAFGRHVESWWSNTKAPRKAPVLA